MNAKLYYESSDHTLHDTDPLPAEGLILTGQAHGPILMPLDRTPVDANQCKIFLQDHAWHVLDLNSRDGTWVNNVRVVQQVRLRDQDTLRCGARSVVFCVEGESEREATPAPQAQTKGTAAAPVAEERIALQRQFAAVERHLQLAEALLAQRDADLQRLGAQFDEEKRQRQSSDRTRELTALELQAQQRTNQDLSQQVLTLREQHADARKSLQDALSSQSSIKSEEERLQREVRDLKKRLAEEEQAKNEQVKLYNGQRKRVDDLQSIINLQTESLEKNQYGTIRLEVQTRLQRERAEQIAREAEEKRLEGLDLRDRHREAQAEIGRLRALLAQQQTLPFPPQPAALPASAVHADVIVKVNDEMLWALAEALKARDALLDESAAAPALCVRGKRHLDALIERLERARKIIREGDGQ